MIPLDIPENQQTTPWVQSLLRFIEEQNRVIQEQNRVIQEQSRVIQEQTEQIAALKTTVQELRDEITRLKNTPKRPKFRPSKTPPQDKSKNTSAPGAYQAPRNAIPKKSKEEVIVKATDMPEGSRFKGYADYSIQELTLTAKDVLYRLEVWQAPDGSIVKAALPAGVEGSHFGPDLRALIHGLYASGMTQPALFEFVCSVGIQISEGQIHNILMGEAEGYAKHSEAIVSAGLQEAPYIRTDDTGARHQNQRGYCTHIGGQYFAYYKTTASKSRLNFLQILAQGKEGYRVNDAFIWHLFSSGIEDDLLNAFEAHKGKQYNTKKGMTRLLNEIGVTGKRLRLICLEAGLIGLIQEKQLKRGQVLLSDRAGQFAILDHAGCWVHMERPLRKLLASTPEIETEIQQVREAIWLLYEQVKEASLSQQGKESVSKAYDALIGREAVSPGVREVLNNFKNYREEMLKALDNPGLPLHNNDSERDIRRVVKFRDISGGTKSEEGKQFRDGLMTLKQTCYRIGQNFWEYLRSWFREEPIDLAECVRQCYCNVATPASGPAMSF